MIENTFNKLIARIMVGIIIGVPLTAASLVGLFYGLMLGYSGIIDGGVWFILVGVVTVFGIIGVCGAWRRLLTSSELMSEKDRYVTRIMLFCGFLSSLAINVWSVFSDGLSVTSLFLVFLVLGGIVFILATPRISSCSHNSMPESNVS